jgi:cyanophycin synthetase
VELLDSRRLTGPNVLADEPAAVIDVRVAASDIDPLIAAWRAQARRMLDAVGWTEARLGERRVGGGVSLGFTAPADALYAATDLNDWAFEAASAVLGGAREPALDADARQLVGAIERESNPRLLELAGAAAARGLPALMDDDEFSIGFGRSSRTWPVGELPPPDRVPWDELASIPVGLVTGTNGKTTTVRLAASMARAAGLRTGLSSTDQIAVDDDVLDHGDYSGPGGARSVLRDQRVDIAVLETARGGLLRRGTAMTRASAVAVTNIAADHLDDFGVPDLEALADIKWLVTRVLGPEGRAVLNAEDPLLVRRAAALEGPIVWFALDPEQPVLAQHRGAGGAFCTVVDGWIVRGEGDDITRLAPIAETPITLGGAARHNVANCLAAAGLANALGVPDDAIATALRTTRDSANPGRCNLFDVAGTRVLVDFAHNPHGVAALGSVVEFLGTGRRVLILGQAGDRGDEAIRSLALAAWGLAPDEIVIKEMGHYARGREPGEVPGILRDALVGAGADPKNVHHEAEEVDAVRTAIELAGPGGLVIALVHEDVEAVVSLVGELAASAG